MYIVIIGANDIGQALVDVAREEGHNVAIVDADAEKTQAAKNKFDIRAFNAEATTALDEIDIENTDVLIATLPDDAQNLMALLYGKELGIKNLVSLVNEPKHTSLFEKHEIQILESPFRLIADHLFKLIDQ